MILLQIRLNIYDIALMGAGLGALLGLIPLILGFVKKERSYGVFGFLGSIVGGAVMGVFLSLPIVAIFIWLILKNPPQSAGVVGFNENPSDIEVENPENL